ncbi:MULTISPECIES: prepilin-type N-terminal cleavage/methylation domain-containing protein [Pseudoalteromonas]|uniref:Type II secretion system protein H n=1 Tax=Pseudoalteromonas distincta TaxID=77608 RepID=A0A4P9J1C0_9GAMM|nr:MULTISPECIES: prepilin-type N-terminal cleavage/methylation domain-containing protein [Pseudoalteromonas]KAA1161265.1 prepilin-type N-terminal cleavage/methylation domain-containing protein [Pseudoalteromonas distincta]MBH0067721.1 prepilin-type N-terminal cleavage/methylation domain-containing protein [Pseudoalteromonas sp. NZS100]QCU74409.1 prepilin-type N-terminal cleavage/methylation domain-containing protein [Pseudoalteromonas distincta]QQM62917.1 prepilin-type N-terminal cleavage/methy|tara:strand:- start:43468 stop:43920 length:453 start_codon:yes stop_codon:yes gene_type:complete
MLVKKSLGFTLLEVLITMTIIGILTAVAAPSFITFIKRDRLVTNSNQLHSVFKFARSEAIKRNQSVSLKTSNKQWLVKTAINSTQTTLNIFETTHSSISVDLKNINISSTGELGQMYQILVSDNDRTTVDFTLCILQSGQSWLVEAPETC